MVRRRMLDAAGLLTASVAAGVLATQVAERSGSRAEAVAQSLTPFIAVAALPAALADLARGRRVRGLLGLGAAAGLAAVLRPARRRAELVAGSAMEDLTIAHENMLYTNVPHARHAAAAMLACGADVLAMSEFNRHHERALDQQGALGRYPFRVGSTGTRSEGVVIWSRYPLLDVTVQPMDRRPGIVATVVAPGGRVRVVLAHPDPPTMLFGLRHWAPSMEMIRSIADRPGPPTLIVADLNAARWHPPFRRMLTDGWRDAHELAGRGLSFSWPTGNRLIPRFVRLDHALVGPGLDLVELRDFDVPGSDHRAMVVAVRASA